MSTLGPVASTATLRAGLRVIGQGILEEKRWIAVAALGSTVYGIMTGGTAWVIGRVVHDTVAPAITARSIATGDLVRAALLLVAVVLANVAGVIVRR
ncbi:MAG TPA: ABC transporter ATP-binding protein, partial [Lapillicoccus sp.]|nr:ABC transporter ATP-binding protein [Lapillicoccus sp.]